MPEYMLEMILANWETQTPRTTLEAGLAKQHAIMGYAGNHLLAHYMQDTVRQVSQIRNWLSRRDELPDRYALANTYLEDDDYATALGIANSIPGSFELSERESVEHADYLYLLGLRQAAHGQGRSIMQLDSTEVAALMALAENGTGRPAAMAQNILCFGYSICYDNPAIMPPPSVSARKASKQNPKQVLAGQYNKVKAYPNPARDYTSLSWELPLLENTATLVITDVTGREVTRQIIATTKGEWAWDTRSQQPGIYFYKVVQNGQPLTNGKIAVVK